MNKLAMVLATGSLVLTTPAFASNETSDNAADVASTETSGNEDLYYTHEGVDYPYTPDDVTIRGDIAGGINTLEGYAARAEAKRLADIAYRDMKDRFDVDEIAPNKYRWDADGASGDAKVVISLEKQLAYAYKGDTLVGVASVSTARDGMVTPTGIFPIWLKKTMHHSKTYDNAPMPYMQMIDSHGIALHAGHNPGKPDSHGCIRLPKQFAKNLFSITDVGTTVLIGA